MPCFSAFPARVQGQEGPPSVLAPTTTIMTALATARTIRVRPPALITITTAQRLLGRRTASHLRTQCIASQEVLLLFHSRLGHRTFRSSLLIRRSERRRLS